MEYSFKRHIHNEYYSELLFYLAIIPFAIYIFAVALGAIRGFINDKTLNFDLILGLGYFIYMPIVSFLFLILLLLRVYNVKDFLKNCYEVDAKIEKHLAYYGSKNYSKREGTETGIRVTFAYEIDNVQYKKGYSISRNKHTKEYFSNYKKQGEMVKLLVHNKNPKKIIIKEVFK